MISQLLFNLFFNSIGCLLISNLILHKEGEISFLRWIKRRIHKNLNFFAGVYGATGSGKSWACLSMSYSMDKDFEIRQVVFEFKELMKVLKSDWFNKKKLKIIIFEELQTSFSNRNWQGEYNKLFTYLISTFRHKNIILLFNAPYADFLDSQTMKLVHAKFDVLNHNTKTGLTQLKPKILQYNSERRKYYYHFLRVLRKGVKGNVKLENMYIQKPPRHLIKPYEKKKTEFTDVLNKKIEDRLYNLDKADEPDTKERKPLTEDSMQPMIWEHFEHGFDDYQQIATKLSEVRGKKVWKSQVGENIRSMRKKGWKIPKNTIN